jgi:ribosomal protein S18 acetylase RimI-like enzyme
MAAVSDPGPIEIVGYDDRFAADFKRLNIEWLEGFDLLEPSDLRYLDAPRATIIAPGGQIFFAVEAGNVIGTCAVRPLGPAAAELVKLAVAPVAQRRGVGRRLAIVAIEHAREWGAEKVTLISNSRLTSAIRLYEALGFRHTPLPADTGYATADVYMELELGPRP